MRSFKKSISQLTPKQRAAFLLAARDLMNELGLPAPSSNEILVATRGSRSAAYEGKVQVFSARRAAQIISVPHSSPSRRMLLSNAISEHHRGKVVR
jgi:hypothetical protein